MAADVSALCVNCGLCCDGTLHAQALLLPEDRDVAMRLGLPPGPGPGEGFALPCRYLADCRCKVYAERPGTCRSYQCELLRLLDAGTIEIEEARNRVREAKALLEDVRDQAPAAAMSATRAACWDELRAHHNASEGAEKAEVSRVLLKVAVLERFLNRWFRGTPD